MIKLILLATGGLMMLAAYRDWDWFFFIPSIRKISKNMGRKGTRAVLFTGGMMFDLIAIVWIF